MYKVINTDTGKTLETFNAEWAAIAYAADVGKRFNVEVKK